MNKSWQTLILVLTMLMGHFNVMAHEDYTGLIENAARPQIDTQKDLFEALAELEKVEEELISEKAELEKHGYDAVSYLKRLQDLFSQLSDDERKKILAGEAFSAEELAASKKLAKLHEVIANGDQLVGPFFEKLDLHIQKLLDVAMAIGFQSLFGFLKTAQLTESQKKEVQEKIDSLLRLKQKYVENKHLYGDNKDAQRTGPYRAFFDKLQKTYIEINDMLSTKKRTPRLIVLMTKSLKVFGILFKIPAYRGVAWNGIKFLKALIKPGKNTPERTSFSRALNSLMRSIAKLKGIKVETEDLHNLPTQYDAKVVNIYAASHRDGLFDQVALAHLGVENSVFFGAVNNFVPDLLNKVFRLKDKLISWANKNPGFIVVGKGASKKATEAVIEIVETTSARSFLIFPGGRLPEGFGATMGVREGFAAEEGLLASLERAGYKINIVPISMRHNATLFNERTPLTGSDHLSVRVGENINDEMRRTLLNIGGAQSLGSLLRYALIEDLVTNDQLIWGQVRASSLRQTLSEYLGDSAIVRQCTQILAN